MNQPLPERRRTVLVLHGGGGPTSVAGLSARLGRHAEVTAPTLPGWNGTPRADSLDRIAAYAARFSAELAARGARDVLVVGSSVGGWIAAEMGVQDVTGTVTGLVLINPLGVLVPGQPIRNVSGLSPGDLAQIAFHDPAKLAAGAPPPTAESRAIVHANQATLAAIAGEPYMNDPTLLERLRAVAVPTLVIWGESDGIVSTEYGRAYAAAFPNGRFELVRAAGHLPQLEQPEETARLIEAAC